MGEPKLTFLQVYEAAFLPVWRFVGSRGIGGAEREDIVQEVFLTIHLKLHAFEGRSSVSTWAVGVAINVMRQHKRRRATRNLGENLDAFSELVESRALPIDSASTKQDAEFLFGVIETLPEPQQEVFTCVDLQEIPLAELAQVQEISLETLRSRLRAARRAINRAIARRQALG